MNRVVEYLKNTVDEKTSIQSWKASEYLNIQLISNYEYFIVSMLDQSFLLIRPVENITISKMKIHIKKIKEKTEYDVALLIEKSTTYKIKKLLEQRMAFITIDSQMFLPFMALHIKKNNDIELDIQQRDQFTPALQMVYLFILYSSDNEFSLDELSELLNVSCMTISRAMKELKHLGVISEKIVGKTGRKKVFIPIDKQRYFQVGKEYLINPVKEIVYVKKLKQDIEVFEAGYCALSKQTMLAEASSKVYAVDNKTKIPYEYLISKEEALQEGLPQIQIMQYDIGKLTKNQFVDPISLIMSITEKDDRTEISIDELMEEYNWYKV